MGHQCWGPWQSDVVNDSQHLAGIRLPGLLLPNHLSSGDEPIAQYTFKSISILPILHTVLLLMLDLLSSPGRI